MELFITHLELYLILSIGTTGINAYPNQQIGCFKDSVPRDMYGYNEIDKELTPQLCIRTCREHGFTYAGVQIDGCHCDNQYGQYGKVHESECSSPCAGDTSLTCGGDRRNSVYTVCPAGKYGADCRFDCPLLCGRNGSESCHYSTGDCIYGCEKGYSHCNRTEIDCYVLKADPRREVGEMNNSPGRWFNLFTGITFNTPGRVSRVDYYAAREGSAFVSFWRKVPNTSIMWTMVGKVKIKATGPGRNSTAVNHNIYLTTGDTLGVHYDDSDIANGVIQFEKSTLTLSEGISINSLKQYYNQDIQDNGWEPWYKMKVYEKILYDKRAPAVHISMDCLQKSCPDNKKYGPDCFHDCIPNCINSICSPINGECLQGCISGWMGSHCNKKCPDNCLNAVCDRFRGLCLNGCSPGFTGEGCFDMCPDYKFGFNCSSECHCANGSKCDHITGACPVNKSSEICEEGWIGCNCAVSISSLQKIKLVPVAIVITILILIAVVSVALNLWLLRRFKTTCYGPIYIGSVNNGGGGNQSATELKQCDNGEIVGAVQYEPFYGDEIQLNGK